MNNEEVENQCECADCGRIIEENDESYGYNGDIICGDCYNDSYCTCNECDDVVHIDDAIPINGGEFFVCEECASDRYTQCADCGEWYDSGRSGIVTGSGDNICERCIDNYYYCEECGEYYRDDDTCYDESTDRYFCRDCYNNLSLNKIYSYHDFRNWVLYKTTGETIPPFYIGFELEIQPKNGDTSYQPDALKFIYENLNAVCMHDGSLGSGGFEIVSHPQSYNYIMEHKQLLKNTFDALISWNYTSHDNTQCGLHFHVSRPQNPEVIDRLWHVLETYKKEIILLSRRTGAQLGRWAQFLSDVVTDTEREKLKALYFIKKTDKNYSRYMALNNENRDTIEFRFFKGSLKFETFMAALQFINNLVTVCSNIEIPIEGITWDVLCDGEYIRPYIEERGIFANFTPIDKSLQLIKKENMQKQLINRILKLISQYSRELLNSCEIKTTNLKTLADMRKCARDISQYYSSLYNNILDDFNYLQNDADHGRVMEFVERAEYLLNDYRIKNEDIKNKLKENVKMLRKIEVEEL